MKYTILLLLSLCVSFVPLPTDKAVVDVLRRQVLSEAEWALKQSPVTVTAQTCPRSAGGAHDFYSEGDYWWPVQGYPDSPYVQRDGMTNPGNFVAHRLAMIRFSIIVGALASAYRITGDNRYVVAAQRHLRAWFTDPATFMHPNLLYAQAIKGRFTGRGIGIIDTIHLVEVVQGVIVMQDAAVFDRKLLADIRNWFRDYLQWLTGHQYGKDEMNAKNNHGTCWVMQVAAFARFTGDSLLQEFCRDRYRKVLLPGQMAVNGSFPLELSRTKPYGYSLFNLDAMVMICHILSDTANDLWHFELPDGRGIHKGITFLYPYVADKHQWPYQPDVMYFDEWPVAHPFLVFAAKIWQRDEWFETWKRLEHLPENGEVLRNLPVRHPVIWL